MKLLIGITTYNRPKYLLELIESFVKFSNFKKYNWTILIVDDSSNKKINHNILKKYRKKIKMFYIQNKLNMGVHYSTNIILDYFYKNNFDIGFKADDDIFFKKSNWEEAYVDCIKNTEYKHLTYYNNLWKKEKFDYFVKKNECSFKSSSDVFSSFGCFWTFSREVIDEVGYFDFKNFGKRGLGHVDYSARCCRAGFNNEDRFLYPASANLYIDMQKRNGYIESMPYSEVKKMNTKSILEFKNSLINSNRVYVPLFLE